MKKEYVVPPEAVIITDCPSQIILPPGALVESAGFKPTSSTIKAIVCEVIQPKLSVTVTVMLSPFSNISVGAPKFLVAPVSII